MLKKIRKTIFMENKFDTLPLGTDILENLKSLGFETMTPVQKASLPKILKGEDVIAQAKTGSGKTAAFGLGIISKLLISDIQLQSLVLCPTRELAEQVALELRRLARFTKNIKVQVICGGTSEYQQINSLDHGVHIVVGTPGRVLKFLKSGVLDLVAIKTLVLDEADRMLDMGFRDEMEAIAQFKPKKVQTLLFSATFPTEIEELSALFQTNPERVTVDSQHEKDVIRQIFIDTTEHRQKSEVLERVLGHFKPESTVVFCKTKQICGEVAAFLKKRGIEALAFHGDLEQNERTVVLTKFSNHSALVLVATDVAARGLDIKDLKAVINFDLATDPEVYTHRIGRTARAGNIGLAISLFVPIEIEKIKEIEAYQESTIEYMKRSELSSDLHFDLKATMKTMYINGGKKEKLRPGDILGALVGVAGLDASVVGNITILNGQSYVAIANDHIDHAIKKLNEGKLKGLKFKVGLA
jgi:ATP-independent RNA helicase DbpA